MAPETFLGGRVTLHCGDSRDVLRAIPDASIHAVVTDPPYALVSIGKRFGKEGAAPAQFGRDGAYSRASAGFMGQKWDTGETAFAAEFWAEVLRVLKPGGHVISASGTRTYHRLAVAIEDAGFEVRDMVSWLYGSGFPKSHDVSKGIDKLDAAAARRERQLRFTAWLRSTGITSAQVNDLTGTVMASHYLTDKEQPAVATREHLEAMRCLLGEIPAWVEGLVDERTVESENFKAREIVGHHEDKAQAAKWHAKYAGGKVAPADAITVAHTPEAQAWQGWSTALKPACEPWVLARKPLEGSVAANVLAHGAGALNIDGCRIEAGDKAPAPVGQFGGSEIGPTGLRGVSDGAADGLGRWPANIVHDGSPEVVAAFPDDAARFFYSAKADADDRLGSKHPTVKPVDLMQWLCRLVTPPGGTVLDPFAGTGTTGEAAWREGFSAVLVEREAEYQADIRRRMALCLAGPAERKRESVKARAANDDPGPLFGAVPQQKRAAE